MKPKRSLRNFLLLTGSIVLTLSAAQADTLYWDGGTGNIGTDGNGLSNGTSGNWNTSLTNWDEGASPHVAWDNTGFDTAVFGTTAATGNTVTLTAPITVGGLRFYNTGYTIAAGTQGLTFGATNNTITLFGTSGTTASAAISGTVGGNNLILTSANPVVGGTVTFNGTSTGGWTGTTTINAGTTLNLAALNQALLNTSAINLNGGGITLTNAAAGEATLNRIADTAGIAVNGGGTINYTNTAAAAREYAETLGAVTLNSGQLNLVLTNNQGSGGTPTNSQTLTLSGLTRTGATNTSAIAFAASGGLNETTNIIRVTGATQTTAGQIIGPWATVGNSVLQSDYAVYNASSQVVGANIAATAENTWGSGANVTLSAGTTLTGTRSLNSLRYTGGTEILALDGNNLETYGVLNGGSGLLTISGAGALTTAAGGGNLFLNTGHATTANITVSAAITNNGSDAVTVVKNGAGTLTLGGTSNYTGGTVINSGTLSVGSASNIGGAGANLTFGGTGQLTATGALSGLGTLTVNQGAVGTIVTSTTTTFATTSGSGTIVANPGSSSGIVDLGDASGFTGNLLARMTGNLNVGGGSNNQIRFTDIADTAGSALQFAGGTSDSGQVVRMELYGNGGQLTFDNRQIQLLPRTGSNWNVIESGLINNNTNVAHTWVINTDLLMDSTSSTTGAAGVRYLALGGSNTGDNAFNGLLMDGDHGSHLLGLRKTGTGKWIVSENNTFTGPVTVTGGELTLSGLNEYTGQTSISGTSTVNVNTLKDFGTASSLGKGTSGTVIAVGGAATSATLNYTGSGDTTNRNFSFANNVSATNSATINNDGSGALIFSAGVFNEFTATGGSAKTFSLTLAGSYTGGTNEIQGVIQNSGGVHLSRLTASGGTWALSGANTYTGTTTVNAGSLLINGSTSTSSAVTVNAGTLGGTGTIGGTVSVLGGATLSPGASIESLVSGALTMASGSNFAYEVANNSSTGADLLAVTGALSLTGVNLNFDLATLAALSGGGWADGNKLTLMSYSDAGPGITSGFTGFADDTSYVYGSNSWLFDYNDTLAGGNYDMDADAAGQNRFVTMTVTVIPEPSSAVLLGALGTLALLRRRR